MDNGRVSSRGAKSGMSPGAVVMVGGKKTETTTLTVIDYDSSGTFMERSGFSVEEIITISEKPTVTWINVAGLHQVDLIESIGKAFSIHPLLLEDMLNTDQRPKLEQYDRYVYIILKTLGIPEETIIEQISMVLGARFILTFEEYDSQLFEPLRQRLRDDRSRIRLSGADYLAYSILDIIVDHYFVALEALGEDLDLLEERLIGRPNRDTLQEIYALKRTLLFMRKSVWPLREVVGNLQWGESNLFQEDTLIYLRDVYEHIIQVLDTLEAYREIASSLVDIYLSSVSQKTNDVMKVLTIIATIFIPLTFITSLYGMNFRYMPELTWRWGYPAVLLLLLLLSGLMLLYFRKKGWL